jgi:Glycogen recognition site of AMP-activated protein kinase
MAKTTKTTKTPRTSSKTNGLHGTNGSVSDPIKPIVTRTEPAKPIAVAEPVKVAPVTPAPKAAATVQASKPAPQPTVSLEFVKPGAKQVAVAGSFNDWKPERMPLTQAANGRWIGDLAVKPGRHEYLFVVDGQWLPDPNAKETVQNPFGGKNSVLTVSA